MARTRALPDTHGLLARLPDSTRVFSSPSAYPPTPAARSQPLPSRP